MNNVQLYDKCDNSFENDEIKQGVFKLINKEFNFMHHNEIELFFDRILNDDIVINEIRNHKLSNTIFYKKLLVLRFYNNLQIMRPYIGNILNSFSLNLDNNINVELNFELMKSLFYANRNNLISVLSNVCCDVGKYKILGEYNEARLGEAIINIWIIFFEELTENFEEVTHNLNISELSYQPRNKIGIIDKILWNLQTRIYDNVDVLLLGSQFNVIYSVGKEFGKYYLEKLIYPNLNELTSYNSLENVITMSNDNYKRSKLYSVRRLQFSNHEIVRGYNLVYKIIDNETLYGYLLFHTSNLDFNKSDYNYILSLIK